MKEALKDKGKRTLADLIIGIVLIDLLALVGNIFCKNKLAYSLGLLLGCIVAIFMCVHMYVTLEKAMLCDNKKAKTKTKLAAFLRMIVMVAALAAGALLPRYVSIISVMIGILALKVSALMQPLTDKFVLKILCKGE